MKSPIDVVKGRIVGYDEKSREALIRAPYDDWYTLSKREYKECLVQMIDSRPLSDKQRKACYALLGEISSYSGMSKGQVKEFMKIKFLADELEETADKIFSLSNAPMSLVCAFQRFLVRFVLDYDIPCNFPLLKFVDDIPDYIYHCLVTKHCCICGAPTDLHHIDRIGMGRDRHDVIHEGLEVLPLCREHHGEVHTMSDQQFFDRYHLPGGIVMDKTLCRLYGLKKTRKKGESA